MSDGTVQRYQWSEFGDELIPMVGGPWIQAADYDALRTQARELARALAQLSNEVRGSLPLEESIIRHAIGNTNYNCLIDRANEARIILAQAQAVLKEGA